jgi:hypothetical protein
METENTNNNEAVRMDHDKAVHMQASTRYLTGDLSDQESEAFEEHFFTCNACAEDIKTGAMFAEGLRNAFSEQARHHAAVPVAPARSNWLDRFWAAWAIPIAAAACLILGVLIYQNAVAIPHLKSEVAALSAPQSLAWVPLKLARGEGALSIPGDSPFWMAYFMLSNSAAFPSYKVDIENSAGTRLKTVTLPAPPLGQPSSILLRRSDFPAGVYKFKVRGDTSDAVIATYSIEIK